MRKPSEKVKQIDPQVKLVMDEEATRFGRLEEQRCSSCGGIPPEYPDQMPGVRSRSEIRRRIEDGQVYELAESDDTIQGREQTT